VSRNRIVHDFGHRLRLSSVAFVSKTPLTNLSVRQTSQEQSNVRKADPLAMNQYRLTDSWSLRELSIRSLNLFAVVL
jgi:hypothetical protein